MSLRSPHTNNDKEYLEVIRFMSSFGLLGIFLMLVFGFALYLNTPGSSSLQQSLVTLFQLDSAQIWWYITRSAGLTGYFLVWLSMVWGFAVSSKLFHSFVEAHFTYDFHEHLSLLGLAFVGLHVIVLLFDRFLPFSLLQVLIPFTENYRPLWVGIGIISFYVMLLVTVTFYIRKQIGMMAFRIIHILSILSYLGVTLHGFFAGTDSALLVTKILYIGTFLVIVFMSVYWVILSQFTKQEKLEAAHAAAMKQAMIKKRKAKQQRNTA